MVDPYTVRRSLDLIRPPLHRYVLAELEDARARSSGKGYEVALRFVEQSTASLRHDRSDTLALFNVVLERWDLIFARKWGDDVNRLIRQLKHARNRHAHEEVFDEDDIARVVQHCARLAGYLGDAACARACNELVAPLEPDETPVPLSVLRPKLFAQDKSGVRADEPTIEAYNRTRGPFDPSIHRAAVPVSTPQLNPVPNSFVDANGNARAVGLSAGDRGRGPALKAAEHPHERAREAPRAGASLYEVGEDLADFFETLGWRTVDKRSKGGCLWVIGKDQELDVLMADVAKTHGIVFQPAPEGGKASGYEPAWFTTNPA
jgi:hypothetical protein